METALLDFLFKLRNLRGVSNLRVATSLSNKDVIPRRQKNVNLSLPPVNFNINSNINKNTFLNNVVDRSETITCFAY